MISDVLRTCSAALVVVVAGNASAVAQDLSRNDSVKDRPRAEYDAKGLIATPLIFYPTANLSFDFTDNVFASEFTQTEDMIVGAQAGLAMETTWSQNAIYGNVNGSYDHYLDQTDESGFEFKSLLGARIDANHAFSIGAEGHFQSLLEDRGAVNSVGLASAERIEYLNYGVNGRIHLKPLPVGFRLDASLNAFDYEDGTTIGGLNIDQDNRDKIVYEVSGRGIVSVSPDMELFLGAGYNMREFDLAPPLVGVNRDSSGWDAAFGLTFKIGRMAQGTASVGYFEQSYDDDPTLVDVDGFDFDLGFQFTPTEVFTLNLNAGRSVEDASSPGVGAYVETSVGGGVDIEVARNVIWSVETTYQDDDYDTSPRDENRFRAGTSVDVFFNRFAGITLEYNFSQQESNIVGRSYDRNTAGISLNLQM